MSLFKKLKDEQLQARKDKETVKINLLTTLLGAVQTAAINAKQDKDNISDDIILSQVKAFIKSAEETLKLFPGLLVLSLELTYLNSYLPKQLTDEELKTIVDNLLADCTLEGGKRMGYVMGELKKQFANQYDASKVKALIS